jgi:hypothetical protein
MTHHGYSAEAYARAVVDALMVLKGFGRYRSREGSAEALADAHRIVAEAGAYYTAAWEGGDDPRVTAQFLWECDIDLGPRS